MGRRGQLYHPLNPAVLHPTLDGRHGRLENDDRLPSVSFLDVIHGAAIDYYKEKGILGQDRFQPRQSRKRPATGRQSEVVQEEGDRSRQRSDWVDLNLTNSGEEKIQDEHSVHHDDGGTSSTVPPRSEQDEKTGSTGHKDKTGKAVSPSHKAQLSSTGSKKRRRGDGEGLMMLHKCDQSALLAIAILLQEHIRTEVRKRA